MDDPNDKPTPVPKRVLPYEPPGSPRPTDRNFDSFGNNFAIGIVLFVASLVLGATLGIRLRNASRWVTLGPPGVVLMMGVVAAFFRRHRGMLTGMLLVALIAAGVIMLIAGMCSGLFK